MSSPLWISGSSAVKWESWMKICLKSLKPLTCSDSVLQCSSSPGFPNLGTAGILDQTILCLGGRGTVLCTVGCLASSLASTYHMLVALPTPLLTTKKCLQKLPHVWDTLLSSLPKDFNKVKIMSDSVEKGLPVLSSSPTNPFTPFCTLLKHNLPALCCFSFLKCPKCSRVCLV